MLVADPPKAATLTAMATHPEPTTETASMATSPQTAAQDAICDRYGMQGMAPEEMVAVALRTLGAMPIHGTRIALPRDGTIGWFIHCGEHSDADDFYQPIHTAHLATLLPRVVDYLRLPPGTKFIIDDQGYEDVWMEA